jgi:hypothetical protein
LGAARLKIVDLACGDQPMEVKLSCAKWPSNSTVTWTPAARKKRQRPPSKPTDQFSLF